MEEKKMLNYLSFRQNTPQCWWAHSKLIRPSNGICPTSVFLLFWKSILIGLEPTTKTRLFCLKKCNTTFSTYKIQKYEILICIFCYNTCTCHLHISHNAPCLPPLSPPLPPPQKKKKLHKHGFSFSWDDCNSQGKWMTKVMQNLWGGIQGVLWEIWKWHIM